MLKPRHGHLFGLLGYLWRWGLLPCPWICRFPLRFPLWWLDYPHPLNRLISHAPRYLDYRYWYRLFWYCRYPLRSCRLSNLPLYFPPAAFSLRGWDNCPPACLKPRYGLFLWLLRPLDCSKRSWDLCCTLSLHIHMRFQRLWDLSLRFCPLRSRFYLARLRGLQGYWDFHNHQKNQNQASRLSVVRFWDCWLYCLSFGYCYFRYRDIPYIYGYYRYKYYNIENYFFLFFLLLFLWSFSDYLSGRFPTC